MRLLLFFLLIGVIAYLIFYFNKTTAILKNQLIIEKNHNSSLRKKLFQYEHSKNLKADFCKPANNLGIIKAGTNIYLSPIENNLILNKVNEKMEVSLLDQCTINDSIWFYITLPTRNCRNSSGWVNANSFCIFYDSTPNDSKDLEKQ